MVFEPEALRFRDDEPDAWDEEEGREPDRSGSERISRTSFEVISAARFALEVRFGAATSGWGGIQVETEVCARRMGVRM